MKVKAKKIIAFFIGVVLVAFLIMMYSSFYGNPITKMIAQIETNSYMKSKYDVLKYNIRDTHYNFKDGGYYTYIDVENSSDEDFSVIYSNGKLSDDREYRVLKKENVINRIQAILNEDKWEEIEKGILREHFDWSLLTLSEEIYSKLENDIAIESLFASYPLELMIYLKKDVQISEKQLEEYKIKIVDNYKKLGITLEKIELNSY